MRLRPGAEEHEALGVRRSQNVRCPGGDGGGADLGQCGPVEQEHRGEAESLEEHVDALRVGTGSVGAGRRGWSADASRRALRGSGARGQGEDLHAGEVPVLGRHEQ